jgi:hypothetical protein
MDDKDLVEQVRKISCCVAYFFDECVKIGWCNCLSHYFVWEEQQQLENLRTVADGSDKGEQRCDEDAGLAPKSGRNMTAWWMDGAPPIYRCLVED